MILIGALSFPSFETVFTPKGFKASKRAPIGRVLSESSPVKITSLSDNAARLVMILSVVPEFARSIMSSEGFGLLLCSFPPVP